MDLDKEFYKQWKTKTTNNHRLFIEKPDFSKDKLVDNDKIFSSTAIDQTDTESFSLRLTESYVDETQESSDSKSKQKPIHDIIMISDSSTDESIFYDKSNKLIKSKTIKSQTRKGIYILESSDDESPMISKYIDTPKQRSESKKNKTVNAKPQTVFKENDRRNEVVEESDSEIEQSRVQDIIKETVAESATLSERKKKEILRWLSTNFDGSRCGSSCSQESAISNSRKSGLSSGNSSLERLELNFETPNNRGKFSKPSTAEKSNKKISKESVGQTKLDQYFTTSKKGQLNIIKDRTPGSKTSDKTPMNSVKANPRRRIIIPESQSIDSKTSESRYSDNTSESNVKIISKKIIIPETQSFESDDQNKFEKLFGVNDKDKTPTNRLLPQKTPVIIPESTSFEISDDTDPLDNSSDLNNKKNKQDQIPAVNTTGNTTINDCADILENLYGTTWRNKATTLISATEPKKQTTKKFFKDPQTEKKITFRKQIFDNGTDSDRSDKEKDQNVPTKRSQTTTKKSNNKNKPKDSFINDESTTESSPDCTYYTALSNPVPSQNNQLKPKSTATVKANDKNNVKKLTICDSESELDNENWKNRGPNQRKLNFDSSISSGTSEFDPEDIVPPRTVTKNIKIKKVVNFQSTKLKISQQTEKQVAKKSFLASLSKDVPLENADFKAMAYRVKYNTTKEDLCKFLYKLFNEKVFENQLPHDMSIEWSVRLRGTAGKCYNKQSLKALGNTVRSSRIVLATKILDSPDRLRDTLIHEMCHAATWLINNVSDGHGSFWKAWAKKATTAFPELPPISRCHNYEIQTKYTYKCTTCGYSIGRHSKSLDLNRKRCGYCHGTFELLINKMTKEGKVQKKSTAQTKKPSGFALYVKENYHIVKQSGPVKHGEVMKILSQQFSAVKITSKPEDRIRNNEDKSP